MRDSPGPNRLTEAGNPLVGTSPGGLGPRARASMIRMLSSQEKAKDRVEGSLVSGRMSSS
jgi:hypothetical protein